MVFPNLQKGGTCWKEVYVIDSGGSLERIRYLAPICPILLVVFKSDNLKDGYSVICMFTISDITVEFLKLVLFCQQDYKTDRSVG